MTTGHGPSADDVLEALWRLQRTIEARKVSGDAGASHTARLLAKGPAACAQKFGEEAVETVIAGAAGPASALVSESADAVYHLMVLLAAHDLTLADVADELARREGRSGLAEKASRSGS